VAASEPTASGFSTLRFRYPGLTDSDPLVLTGPSSGLSLTRTLFKASLVSRLRFSSQGPGRLGDCVGLAEPRSQHATARPDGGAVFSGDIPQASPQPMHTGRTPAALQARAGARYAGVGPEPGRIHPARTRRGRSCNRGSVTVRACLNRCAMLPLAHAASCALGRLALTSSRLRRRSLPSESPVLPRPRRSGPVALPSPRLLELDPSPAPPPPTLQYTSPRAGQPYINNIY
jgi:hypothetical protein